MCISRTLSGWRYLGMSTSHMISTSPSHKSRKLWKTLSLVSGILNHLSTKTTIKCHSPPT